MSEEIVSAGGVRSGAVAAVFAVALGLIAATLYVWWPAGVVVGILLGTVATVIIGRRLQAQAAAAPDDDELLELLAGPSAAGRGVTRSVWSEDAMPVAHPRRASIR